VLHPFSDEEWDTLPHVILTGNADWDPGVLDQDLDDNEAWFDAISDLLPDKPPSAFDEVGDYTKQVVVQSHDVLYSWDTSQHIVDACVMMHTYQAHAGNNCCISEHHDPDDTTLEDQPPCMNPMPMRSARILLTISCSGPCLDGFLLI